MATHRKPAQEVWPRCWTRRDDGFVNIVINASSARVGGAITYLRGVLPALSDELVGKGNEVILLVQQPCLAALESPLDGLDVRSISGWWMGLPGGLRTLFEQVWLPVLLARLNADVVFGVGDTLPILARVPGVVLCRNALIYQSRRASLRLRLMSLLTRATLRRASVVIFVSQALADEVLARRKVRRAEIVYHGPGLAIPYRRREGVTSPIRLLAVSSLYRHKRVEIAIEATRILRSRGIHADLSVVGPPIDQLYVRELRELVVQFELSEHVTFHQASAPHELRPFYETASMLLITSASESFCHPILEGFSAGVAVVVPEDLPVAKEISQTHAVQAATNGEAYADAVEKLAGDEELYRRITSGALTRSQDFSWHRTGRATAECLITAGRES